MSDLGKSGDIPVKVRKRFSHLIELIEIVPIPRQGWSSAMGSDDIDPALQGQSERLHTLEIPAMDRQRELAPGMRQEGKIHLSHSLPERSVGRPIAINGLHAGQQFQEG